AARCRSRSSRRWASSAWARCTCCSTTSGPWSSFRAVRGRVLGAAAAVVATLVCAGGTGAAPQFVVVFRVVQPHVRAGRALGLAQSLGFAAPSVRTEASAFVVTSGARELVLYKASGGFDYVDRATYGKPAAAPLPTKTEARRAAIDFLRRHALLPGQDARI